MWAAALLAKALLTANNESRCARLLKTTLEVFPDAIRSGSTVVLEGGKDRNRFHRLIDGLLGLIPKERDTLGAMKDPPADYDRLFAIYRQRKDTLP